MFELTHFCPKYVLCA